MEEPTLTLRLYTEPGAGSEIPQQTDFSSVGARFSSGAGTADWDWSMETRSRVRSPELGDILGLVGSRPKREVLSCPRIPHLPNRASARDPDDPDFGRSWDRDWEGAGPDPRL